MKPQVIRLTGALGPHVQAAAVAADDTKTMSGQIATYGATVHPHGPWENVRLAAGSLSPAGPVKLMDEHDGVIGSLDGPITEDEDGNVFAAFRFAKTARASDVHSLVRDGHVDGLSVGYLVRDGQEVIEDGQAVFEVTAADLLEVSVVAWPADHAARISTVTAKEGRTMTVTEPQDRGVIELGPDGARATAQEISDAVQAALKALAPQYAAPAIPPQAGAVQARDEVTADGYGRFLPGYTTRDGQHITAGDYLSAVMRMRDGDSTAYARIAAANDVTTQIPGLLPVQIMQPVINTLSPIRPLFEACNLRVMPANGSKFQRPKIKTHVAVDEQTAELEAVASQAMEVSLDDVTKRTIAGSLKLSVQAVDWSTPALLDLVIADFADVYAKWTESDISKQFAAAATGTPIEVDPADGLALNAAFYDASAASWTEGGIMPNRAFMSLKGWSTIGSQGDKNGRPLYPFFGSQVNAMGSLSPAGMLDGGGEVGSFKPVVAPYLAAGKDLYVGPSQYCEVYEDRRGMLRVADPSALGQVIGWYGYVASYFAVPKSIVPIVFKTPVPPAK
jgi:HK97 family phage prohead protease